jgi:hypothetical protein
MNDIIDLSPKLIRTLGDEQVQQFAVDMRVYRMVRARRDEILDALHSRQAEPTDELLRELAELDDALGIEPLDPIEDLRAQLKADEKETCRRRIQDEIETETDEIDRLCLERSLALIDDPTSPWNQE